MLFVGINPGLRSAELGHHYAGHGNRFWKLLYESGLLPEPLGFADDARVPEFGLGLTNIVARESRSSSDLDAADFEQGRRQLERKILRLQPALVAFVGIVVHRAFFDERGPVECGLSARTIGRARVFVAPNPSGRNAHYPYARMLAIYRELAALARG